MLNELGFGVENRAVRNDDVRSEARSDGAYDIRNSQQRCGEFSHSTEGNVDRETSLYGDAYGGKKFRRAL
jgi:hypothetical protein